MLFIFCGKPSENAEEINYLDLINSNVSLVNAIKNNKTDFTVHAGSFFSKYKGMIVAFYKGSEIILDSIEAEHDENTVIYTTTNNKFRVNKPFYITLLNKRPVFSFDNKTWYYIKNNAKKNIQSINYDYMIYSEKKENTLLIRYKAALSAGSNPIVVNVPERRTVITLKKGMIYNTRIKEIKKDKLTQEILYVPEGTILSAYHIVKGDFIQSSYINGKIIIKALDDIYLYAKNLFNFYVSLDKKDWGLNIVSFDAKPAIELYVIEDNELFFNISTSLNYNKDKVSVMPSLLKLLLNNK